MNRELAAQLAHDVGKYVARIAHNVPAEGAVPAALVPMLVKDLYELPGGVHASARLEELAPGEPSLGEVREALAAIDALESDVRRGDPEACRSACTLALEVESALRTLAAEAR